MPTRRSRQVLPLCLLLATGALALDCPGGPAALPSAGRTHSLLIEQTVPAREPSRLHALLINGGGGFEVNYRSHRQHLERMLELLRAGGVERSRIAVFASDGANPEPDLAILDGQEPEDFWLLPWAGLGQLLKPQMEYVSTEIEGVALREASRAELEKWFREEGSQLRPGETLLLYVTDHGNRNPGDLEDNTISLWNGEHVGVREFQTWLDRLDPGLRVVMLMSQCFGGSFAHAIFSPAAEGALRPNVCGYFATTAERPAYGCYAENLGREGVGHSDEVFDAWNQLGELLRAHRRSLVTDDTPDVPNTTRDFQLARWLRAEARDAGVKPEELVDRWMRQAWKDRASWEPEIRLLDQISHAFGLFSPRSLAEFEAEAEALPALSEQLDTYADRWEDALEVAKQETWLRFASERKEWPERVKPEVLRSLDPAARDALLAELLADFSQFVRTEYDTLERLLSLRRKAQDSRSAHYRTEVRIGAVLRMRTLLTSIAARTWLEHEGTPAQRAADERLARCEALTLLEPQAQLAALPAPEPLPQLADDHELIESVMPSWMGIRYQPVAGRPGAAAGLPRGAVQVMTVYPDSPAAAAGMRVADVVLGTPERRFDEVHAIREWTMQSELGEPTRLELLRSGKELEITLVPGPFPIELPALPGPPKVGSTAPALGLELHRGVQLAGPHPRLLFFWATWCGPCKQSVPELLAFAEQRGVEVLAITDEEPGQIDPYLREHADRFPENVVSDPLRVAFQDYGVSATPTFVLIDEAGVIQLYQRGYSAERGLELEGWDWAP